MTLALVMFGAGVGAACRWLLDQRIQTRLESVFPWGTFTVNVLGSLILGFVLGADHAAALPGGWVAALAGTGFCGGFTTFSTFGYETAQLSQEGSGRLAWGNILASLGAGLAAAYLGWYLALAVLG